MRAKTVLALATALALMNVASVQAGQWGTSEGTMTLPDEPMTGAIRAPYTQDDGRIVGRMNKLKTGDYSVGISGVWIESQSAKACATKKEGSPYWGNVTLQFNAAYDAFTGRWDYCGEGGGGSWTGKLGASKGGVHFK
ncbi:MAG: hypothetical protein WAT70_01130 [Rhizobiaceae bacterium]